MPIIGQTFKARAKAPADMPREIKVTGADGNHWTIAPVDFGPTISISADDLATWYGAPLTLPAHVDEVTARMPSQDAMRAAMSGYRAADKPSIAPPPGADTPEAYFAAVAAEAESDDA